LPEFEELSAFSGQLSTMRHVFSCGAGLGFAEKKVQTPANGRK
jgi:hypothetical protein